MEATRRYYEEEMRYLHEAGKVFAEAHPEVARLLNVDSVADRDPYVERLFEGFAFLTGRIRERLDDEMPAYTEALCNLLYPHYLRPIPSLCIVECRPKVGLLQHTTVLDRGTEVQSQPVGEEFAVCRFATTQALTLQPIRLTNAALGWATDGTSHVTIRFELDRGVKMGDLDLSSIRLYLHADASIASSMHLFFTRFIRKMVVRSGETSITLQGQSYVRPGGLSPDEGLVDYGPNSFSGFRLLQEYLCFRRKFWFVDLLGIGRLGDPEAASFEVDLVFDRAYPEDRRFKTENLRLHCSPVVNLFSSEAEPIRMDGYSSEYRVTPSIRYRKSIEAYEVEDVTGIEEAGGKRHTYAPYFRFRDTVGAQRHFVARRHSGLTGRPEITLTLTGLESKEGAEANKETLSVQLTCTNGSLPKEKLVEGMINQVAPEVPQVVTPTNLTQPTLTIFPPTERHEDFFWKLISHWSLNYTSIATREALTGLLALYDWTGDEANRKRLAGISDVRWASKEVLRRGSVLRGAEVTVTVLDGSFYDEGDLNLFGIVLSEFLSMYATINSFVHLVLELSPSGRRYEWKPMHGATPVV